MSDLIKFARPYAKAAFQIARDQQKLPVWTAMLKLASHTSLDAAVADMINNPSVPHQKLTDLFTQVGGESFDSSFGNLIALLSENGRLAILPEIAAMYEKLRQDEEKRLQVRVVSAIELDSETQSRMQTALTRRFDKEVSIHTEVDASLLGGAVIIADDLVIDGSVRGRLEKMSARLSE